MIHRSDRGEQYTALAFGESLKEEAGVFPSVGRVGLALENAMAESFVCTLKAEMPERLFPTRETARTAVFEYIEGRSYSQVPSAKDPNGAAPVSDGVGGDAAAIVTNVR